MDIKSFFTVVVVEFDVFESRIIDERHFGNRAEAEAFSKNVPSGCNGFIREMTFQD